MTTNASREPQDSVSDLLPTLEIKVNPLSILRVLVDQLEGVDVELPVEAQETLGLARAWLAKHDASRDFVPAPSEKLSLGPQQKLDEPFDVDGGWFQPATY